MDAADIVLALQHSLNRRHTDSELNWDKHAFVTAMLVPRDGEIHVDKARLHSFGVKYVTKLLCWRCCLLHESGPDYDLLCCAVHP